MTSSAINPRPGAYRFTVTEKFAGLRLDQYFAESSDSFSRSLTKRLIEIGGVHLAGRRMRHCSQPVSTGDSIEVFVDNQPLEPMLLVEENIIYRDQDLIVLNKPAGMATQPTPARYQGTVYSELQNLLRDSGRKDLRPSIGMVQRLDRDTSGVLVFSIHKRAHKKMTEAFRGRNIDKVYWALIYGRPQNEQGEFCSQLARRRSTNLVVSVARGGKAAETHYRLLQVMDQASLVEVKLITGRTHQIRAHFSEAGLPLLGDIAYGGPQMLDDLNIPRQMLHSRELTFCHPVTGKEMGFTAHLPNDFTTVLQNLDGSLNGVDA
ncbi:MAG: RluA family pseudouridine synthase [Candidatus Marinimicrobia bacterium]|nr:RluA family pseudouridine synthase [Candidatus Neomarinimicrobiota bacterium]